MVSSTNDSHSSHHVLPMKVYYGVFGALMVLTVITVGVSYMHLPPTASIFAAMVVAIVKAALVAGYFMHLKYDDKFNALVFGISVLFLVLFFAFTLIDLDTRSVVKVEEGNFYKVREAQLTTEMEAAAAKASATPATTSAPPSLAPTGQPASAGSQNHPVEAPSNSALPAP
ncbi:MAG: cytochrome C oxidase subunit IV family protein [Myxococcales bacterium]|nr:cytochrome C oxidase subunit IV family protein [Myxococcales bacterium]